MARWKAMLLLIGLLALLVVTGYLENPADYILR